MESYLERRKTDFWRRFRVAELAAGTWTLLVRTADGRATLHQGEVALKQGQTKELKIEAKEIRIEKQK